jgi:hypothetical protein
MSLLALAHLPVVSAASWTVWTPIDSLTYNAPAATPNNGTVYKL